MRVSRLYPVILAFGLAAAPGPGAPSAAAQNPSPSEDAYTYNPEGRRDPFRSLVNRGADGIPDRRPPGLSGLLVSEATIRGIVQSGSEMLAMIQGPDQQTFTARTGDALLDGSVKLVEIDAVVFLQNVNDPLSLVTEREVRKPLRSLEDAR